MERKEPRRISGKLLVALLAVVLAIGCAVGGTVAWLVTSTGTVTNTFDDTVSVIDSARWEVVRTFPVGRRPRGLTFSRDGRRLFVCASDSDAVQVIEPDTGRLLHNLPSGEDPEQEYRVVRALLDKRVDGMIINPAGLTFTSISVLEALKLFPGLLIALAACASTAAPAPEPE